MSKKEIIDPVKRIIFQITATNKGLEWWCDETLTIHQIMALQTSLRMAADKVYEVLMETSEVDDE